MTTKHIDDRLWRLVEQKTVEAVIDTRVSIKETQMLKWLIKKGLEEIKTEDYRKYMKE